jgi:hypothetical protein
MAEENKNSENKVDSNSIDNELRNQSDKIIENIPELFRHIIQEGFNCKRVPKEYSLSSILYTISSAIGKTFYTKELNYKNYANGYFIIVGSRGDAKTEALKIATKPIMDFDNESYELFDEQRGKDTENNEVPRKQILIQNATIEKAQLIHYQNSSGIGLCFDEIRAIIQKMNNVNSRDGHEWEVFLLEAFTNGIVDVSRKTTDTFRIKQAYLTMLGGIQHQFIPDLFSKSLVGSGLIDRLLFTTMITNNSTVTRDKIDEHKLKRYNIAIQNLLKYKKQSEEPEEEEPEIRLHYTPSAEKLLFKFTQQLETDKSNAESPLKEYYSKMLIYLHKLVIICFLMENCEEGTFKSKIEFGTVLQAKRLIDFYILNFKKIITMRNRIDINKKDVIKLAKANNASQKSVVDVLGISKGQVSKLWKRA